MKVIGGRTEWKRSLTHVRLILLVVVFTAYTKSALFAGSEKMLSKNAGAVKSPTLRLANPSHPARKQLDETARIVDQCVEIIVVGDYMGIKKPVPIEDLRKAIPILEKAIAICPNDMDLLVTKACILDLLGQKNSAETLINMVLKKVPEHFEAKMWKNLRENWRYPLSYPRWGEKQSSLHPVMLKHLSLEHRVQLVRDGLQKTLAIVIQVKGPPFDRRTKVKVKWVLSKTPYGPLVAWYLRIIEPSGEPSTMEAFLPIFKPKFMPMEGYSLVQQLASNPYCFVVITQGDTAVLNHKLIFSEKNAREIRDIASQLATTKSYLSKQNFNRAMQWHMTNFDMNKLAFD